MKYLLDTNVIKEIGKPSAHKNVAAWIDGVDDLDLAISVLSVREISKGIERKRGINQEKAKVLQAAADAIIEAFEGRIFDVDLAIALHWGKMLGQSEKHVDDTGLAATAHVHGLVVVTRNETDFIERGVEVLNPFKKIR